MMLHSRSVKSLAQLHKASQVILWNPNCLITKPVSFSTKVFTRSTVKCKEGPIALENKCSYSLKFRPKESRGDFGKRPAKVSRAWRSALVNLGMPLFFIGFFMYLVINKPSWFNKGDDTLQINTNIDNTAYVNKVREELWARKIRKESGDESK